MPETAPNLVDGAATPSASADTIEVVDPATGAVIGVVPAGCPADADAAVASAAKAAGGWARTAPAERAAALKATARELRDVAEELAVLQTREGGKPLDDSRGGVEAGIATMEQYAELGPLHRGRSLAGGWGATDLMVHEPRGVTAVLTPWNDPVAISLGLLAASLVTGNTVVFSPSERTPLSGARLAEIIAGHLPPGVLSLVHGDGRVGAPLVAHPEVALVLHVGASATGRSIARATAETGAHLVHEGGGKDALVVDAGVDPAWAASQAALGAYANTGQICTSVERIYVHADVAEQFVASLVIEAERRMVGDPQAAGTDLGPMVDELQRDIVADHVAEAVAAGAVLRAGGVVPPGPGAYYPPTVLTGCTDDMLVMREETFGPVAAVRVVSSYDEGLAAAGRSAYGLAATVLTADPEHAQRAWRELPVGTVKVNAVFGGAPGGAAQPGRGSGQGFGYGPELLDEVTRTKVVHLGPLPTGHFRPRRDPLVLIGGPAGAAGLMSWRRR